MGIFKKMFQKKECSICGGEIGLLGNRKLEDGNMCKSCAGLLSPWFNDRRTSTVDEIKEQLAYRKDNKAKVAAFHTTRTLGERVKVLLDEDAKLFMVTSARERDLAAYNPDVLTFSDVTGCNLDIDESRTEIKQTDKEGNSVSYNPPRYTYSYDFYLTIYVHNPYFDQMRIKLNNNSVEIESQVPRHGVVVFGGGSGMGIDPENNMKFRQYKQMGEEIRETLLQLRQETRDEVSAAAAASAAEEARIATPWVCTACGAQNKAGGKFCEFCGSARPQ